MRPETRPHLDLAAMAKRQHGVVSIDQLVGDLGYSHGAVKRAARAGRLHRVYRGVYAVGHTALALRGWCLAAVLGCGEGAVLSHHSAAWLWGLSRWSPIPLHVTGPSRRGPARPGLREKVKLHHARHLMAEDRGVVDEIPVTAVPRICLDLAARLKPNPMRQLLQRAEELEIFDLTAFDELLMRTAGHHGHGRLRRALALYRPSPYSRSGLELRFLEMVLAAGLPRPATGFVEAGYELDVYWPEERFAVELDTFETHGSHAAFEEDRHRQETLKLADVEMTRVTGYRLDREPRQVMQRIARLLAQRRDQNRR